MPTSTPGESAGSTSRKNAVVSEFMNTRCEPSKKTTSPASSSANTLSEANSNGARITRSHSASTSARGAGSIEMTRVDSSPSRFARAANFVEFPEPTSR